MDDLYFSVNKEDGRILCLSPLNSRLVSMADQEIKDQSGYFLYEKEIGKDETCIKILAQVFSDDAIFFIRNQFGMI